MPAVGAASPMRWDGVPHERVRLGIFVTATASGLIAALVIRNALRDARPRARALQLALAAALAAISLRGAWLLFL